jgi:hypothetical protein
MKEMKLKEKKRKKENEFKKLILEAYKAIKLMVLKLSWKKKDNFVSIGPINQPYQEIMLKK